jgi:sterol desaturase/sphingolipid hydroxylase (fatty acid hydroxylase superfamily)
MEFEPYLRLGAFLAVFAAMALWELAAPRRKSACDRRPRWPANLGIVLVDTLALRVVFPGAAVGMAVLAEAYGWGWFHAAAWPFWLEAAIAFVVLDFAIYLQHVLFHAVPALWRLHRMHHTDLDFDVTTGLRFHPLEILISMGLKWAVIAALGAPALAVLVFEVVLNATSLFNHGNVRMAAGLDRRLRWLVVTPDMHRVHHSVRRRETNSNFGFNLPWWDRLLGTYRDQPEAGHEGMTIGIKQFRDPRELGFGRLLTQPFREDAREYPINR